MGESKFKDYIRKSPLASMAIFSLSSFIIGALLFWAFFSSLYYTKEDVATKALRLNQTSYPLIDPLLLCNIYQKETNHDKKLTATIKKFVDERISSGQAENMSVYVINYGGGQWAGVNEEERYDPASLLKIPIMVTYYKKAETDPSILSERTSFKGDDQNVGEYFKSENNIKSGKMYSIEELIESMVVNSDNTASTLLENYIDKDTLYNVYTDLGLPTPNFAPNMQYLSVRSYAFFFRVLYNGTYLDRKYSEKALELLSRADIKGIRSGVPEGITVAQKFGERSVYDQYGVLKDRELHDCGIVYKEGGPYLLCVMSRGKDFDALAKNISDLSALVYENIDK